MLLSFCRAIERQQLLFLGVFATLFSLALGFGPKPSPFRQAVATLKVPTFDAAAPDRMLRPVADADGELFRSGSTALAAEPLAEYFRSVVLARQVHSHFGDRGRLISNIVYDVTPDRSTGSIRLTASGPSAEINEAFLRELVGAYEDARSAALAEAARAPQGALGRRLDEADHEPTAQAPGGRVSLNRNQLDAGKRLPLLLSGPHSRAVQSQMSWELMFLAAVLSGALATLAVLAADRRR